MLRNGWPKWSGISGRNQAEYAFKETGNKSNHSSDVVLLREVVENPAKYSGAIIEPEALKMVDSDTLKSAFMVAGINAGIPTLIMRNG